MKRILTLGLVFAFIMSVFSGCAQDKLEGSEINDLLKKAFSNTKALNSINAKSSSEVSYDFGSVTNSVITESTIMESDIGNKDKYEMSTDVTVKSLGSETTYETYYKDGFYYTSRYGGKFKSKIDIKDIERSSSVSLVMVPFDDMKTVAAKIESNTSREEKLTYVNFTCKNTVLKKHIEKSFSQNENDLESATITDSKGQYIINDDGYITSEMLSIKFTIVANGKETKGSISVKTELSNVGEKVNPYDPEDSEYTQVQDLLDIVNLSGAMGKVLTSDNVDMEMQMQTEIKQDEIESGYKRNYLRKLSTADKNFMEEVSTTFSDVKTLYNSGQYFTDGTYYNSSNKIKADMDFGEFYGSIYSAISMNPVSIYATGMMKELKSQKSGDDTVYSFSLNPNSDEGISFLQMLFAPYEQFGGDCASAETKINSFNGKSYVNSDGEYYKTVMECDLIVKFNEGDVAVKCEQTININSTNRDEIKFSFPKFKGYDEWDKEELLKAFS